MGQGIRGLGAEAKVAVRAELGDRIDGLARELPHINACQLSAALDDIHRIARNNHLETLADVARGLENAIADSGGAAMVLPFLEAMGDAVDDENGQNDLDVPELRRYG